MHQDSALAGRDLLPPWLVPLLAVAGGMILANLYYAQPLVGPISHELGIAPGMAGLIVTMTQVGYGLGLVLLVPLGDILDKRRLMVCLLMALMAALVLAALAHSMFLLFATMTLVGMCTVVIQVMLPYVSQLVPETMRGQTVGKVVSGMMLGIMLSRPVASFITSAFSWHVVFALSALLMTLIALVLGWVLPHHPVQDTRHSYPHLLLSLAVLLRDTPALRRRALAQAGLFAAFSMFWTVAPLQLATSPFSLGPVGIGIFALIGVSGAVCAPIAGRLADRGWSRRASIMAMLMVIAVFALSSQAPHQPQTGIVILALTGILLDASMTGNAVLVQRAIFMSPPAQRSRLNGLYTAIFFLGGACGSALGGLIFARFGWAGVWRLGAALPVLSLCIASARSLYQPQFSSPPSNPLPPIQPRQD